MASRSLPVPALFRQFSGYNQPELRKKRKRDSTNLKEGELEALATSLFSLAGSAYMKRTAWRSFHDSLLKLADNFRKYAAYFKEQRDVVNENHAKNLCAK